MPEPPKVSVSAGIQANLAGTSRGTDFSLLGLGTISLVGALGCLWLSIWTPWALIGSGVFLSGFLYILNVWRKGTSARAMTDSPPATISWKSASEELAISIPNDDQNYAARKMLAGMRAVMQQRQLPPTPRGSVQGNPADHASLTEYSPEERAAVEKKWAEDVPRHDEKVVDELTSAIRSLESGSNILTPGSAGKDEGLQQLDTEIGNKQTDTE